MDFFPETLKNWDGQEKLKTIGIGNRQELVIKNKQKLRVVDYLKHYA